MLAIMQPTSWRSIALVFAGIILGCGANAMSGAHAQQVAFPASPSAQTWQQYCEIIDNVDQLNERVRAAGSYGFELVNTSLQHGNGNDTYACFKRPAP
jgi:hypothetical protein